MDFHVWGTEVLSISVRWYAARVGKQFNDLGKSGGMKSTQCKRPPSPTGVTPLVSPHSSISKSENNIFSIFH